MTTKTPRKRGTKENKNMDYKARQDELMAKIKTARDHLDKAREEQDKKEWLEWYGLYTDLWEEYDKIRGK